MNETELIGQLIELRAKGWPYEKIARHTGIGRKRLLAWGIRYKNHIDAEKEIIRATLEEIRRIRAKAANSRLETQDVGLPDGAAQESYFHNLEGYPAEPKRARRRAEPLAKPPELPNRLFFQDLLNRFGFTPSRNLSRPDQPFRATASEETNTSGPKKQTN